MRGPYQLLEELGRGGMGTVHRARAADGQPVAVKRLALAGDADAALRFRREQRLGALLGDAAAGFVPVLDAFVDPHGCPCLVMPLLPGGSLRDRLRRGPLPPAEVVALGRDLARALGRAHALGVVHRDVKPENVLFDAAGRPLVSDLGLAKHVRRDVVGGAASLTLTAQGDLLGTVGYLAPEHLGGSRDVGPAADVFALGVLLYECLAGARPFEGASPVAVAAQALEGRFAPVARAAPGTPPALAALVEACLRPDPAARPADGAAVAAALAALDRPAAPRRRAGRPALALLGGGLALAAAAAGLHLARRPGPPSPAPPPPAPPPPAPPPPAPAPVWRLGAGPPAELVAPALWVDAAGREAWPLRGAAPGEDAAPLADAFLGAARRAPDGRVRVRYGPADLARGRVRAACPGRRAAFADAPVFVRDPEGVRLTSPRWSSALRLVVGGGRWRDADAAARLHPGLARGPDDLGWYAAALGLGEEQVTLSAPLGQAALTIGGVPTIVPAAPPAGPLDLALSARGPATVAGVTVAAPPGAAGPGTFRGAAWVQVEGGDTSGVFRVEAVEVEGVPEASDAPALAAAPVPAAGDVRLTADVDAAAPAAPWPPEGAACPPGVPLGPGGPLLAIGDPRGDRVTLEVAGGRLVLGHGPRPLGTSAAVLGPGPVRLVLERRGDAWRGWAEDPGGGDARARVEGWDPLPLATDAPRAAWGSTGPRVRFAAVTLEVLGPDPARDARDAAAARGAAPDAPGDGRGAWWAGAALLADAHDPPPAEAPPDGAARAARLDQALRALTAAADDEGLPPPARRDARARAVLAAVLLGDLARAEGAAAALVADEGGPAGARVDALERGCDGRPSLLERLVEPYHRHWDAAVGRAGLRAAWHLAPDRRPPIAAALAQLDLAAGLARRDAGDPAGARRLLEEARRSLAAALPALPPAVGAARTLGDVEEALASVDPAGALEHLRRADAAYGRDRDARPWEWYGWAKGMALARALMQLGPPDEAQGRADAALEGALGVAALRPQMRDGVREAVRALAPAASPGLAACALLALGGEGGRGRALDLARRASAAPAARERDLARYAALRLGEPLPPPGPDEAPRPTLALARAAAGDPEGLAAAADADALVLHLALLDPALRGHVRLRMRAN